MDSPGISTQTATDTQDRLSAALRYAAAGLAIFPVWHVRPDGSCGCGRECSSPGKHPIPSDGVKAATTDEATIRRWWGEGRPFAQANIGMATGSPSGLWVLDIDGREGRESIRALCGEHGALPPTMRSETGGGGFHLFFELGDLDVRNSAGKLGRGIDVRGEGGYVLLPPSSHVSGTAYRWSVECDPEVSPPWLSDRVVRPERPPHAPEAVASDAGRPEGGATGASSAGGGATEARRAGASSAGGSGHQAYARAALERECAVVATAAEGTRNDALNRAAFSAGTLVGAGVLDEGEARRALEAAGQAVGLSEREVSSTLASGLSAGLSEPRRLPEPRARPVAPSGAVGAVAATEARAKALAEGAVQAVEDADWRNALIYKMDKSGEKLRLESCLPNAITILAHSEQWTGVLAWDAFRSRIVTLREPPWHSHDRPATDWACWQEWTDGDDVRLQSWLQRATGIRLGREAVTSAVLAAAERIVRHPVREYLSGLEWDGRERVGSWLVDYYGAENTEYVCNVGRWWLVSAVARVMRPGCQVNHLLILEGTQQIGKSSSLRVLFGEDWFTDRLPDISTKDSIEQLEGVWCVEVAELATFSRADANKAKQFFSTHTDRLRRSYARRAQNVPRQCVFIGTTNDQQYLKDPTGDERYWPARCGASVDRAGIERDRDQLWAEAFHLYGLGANNGGEWWPKSADDRADARHEQAARYVVDEWETIIAKWCEGRTKDYVTVRAILTECLDIDVGKISHQDQIRVARCVMRLGYSQRTERIDGRSERVYRIR